MLEEKIKLGIRKLPSATFFLEVTRKKKCEPPIQVISFDFDGCLFHHDYLSQYLKANSDKRYSLLLDLNKVFLEKLARETIGFKKLIVLVGSARQSYAVDQLNSSVVWQGHAKETESCFSGMIKIADFFRGIIKVPVILDKFLLADIAGHLSFGQSYFRIINSSYKKPHVDWQHDVTKFTILYAQMHKLARENPKEEIIFDFYDDRKDILEGLRDCFKNKQNLMPKNITLNLHQYLGPKVKLNFKSVMIEGTGAIDEHFKDTIRNIGTYCLQKKLNPLAKVTVSDIETWRLKSLVIQSSDSLVSTQSLESDSECSSLTPLTPTPA